MEDYLKEKRSEIIWALNKQGYTGAQISRLFNTNQMTIKRIIDEQPTNFKVKWVKVR